METRFRILYEAAGIESRAIPVKTDFPFSDYLEEIAGIDIDRNDSERIADIAGEETVRRRAGRLAEFLSISADPGRDILYILSRAVSGDKWGMKLLFTIFLAEPSPARVISEYSGFENLRRLMKYIGEKVDAGRQLSEREQLLSRKVELLPISHPLPGSGSDENSWEGWKKGVSRAMSDPDNNWEDQLRERIYAELEARLIRVNRIFSEIDSSAHRNLAAALVNMREKASWTLESMRDAPHISADSTLYIKSGLSGHWKNTLKSLEKRAAGRIVKSMFEAQEKKVHSYPGLQAGTAVVRAVLNHPQVSSYWKPDILSSLQIFLESSGRDRLEFVFPSSRVDAALFRLQGFRLEGNILTVEFNRISRTQFLDTEGIPLEFDWGVTIEKGSGDDYKFMILSNLDNASLLKHILENPKLASKPGVVSLISLSCKSADVLTRIATRRDLYTGFANKDVPRNLLMNPARIPLTALRKFIHVRYIDKMTLRHMANKGGQVREEIRREIEKYLNSQ
ncbi:MAG: hypothetical protein R6U43_00205 [Candidatus Krumholzibacteriales bacterium]